MGALNSKEWGWTVKSTYRFEVFLFPASRTRVKFWVLLGKIWRLIIAIGIQPLHFWEIINAVRLNPNSTCKCFSHISSSTFNFFRSPVVECIQCIQEQWPPQPTSQPTTRPTNQHSNQSRTSNAGTHQQKSAIVEDARKVYRKNTKRNESVLIGKRPK